MISKKTNRGFIVIEHNRYPDGGPVRLLQESSIVGHYDDALDNPGSSALWVGEDHHLNRENVGSLVRCLHYWLDDGRLPELA